MYGQSTGNMVLRIQKEGVSARGFYNLSRVELRERCKDRYELFVFAEDEQVRYMENYTEIDMTGEQLDGLIDYLIETRKYWNDYHRKYD